MGRNETLTTAALVGLLAASASALAPVKGADATNSSAFVSTAAVQVTQNPDPVRAHAAPMIAVNPTNGELVITETEYRTTMACSVHLSTNDGRSWGKAGNPMLEPYTNCGGDPIWSQNMWPTFDSKGTLLVSFTAQDPAYNNLARISRPRPVFLARSTDGGRSFDTYKVFEAMKSDREDRDYTINRLPRVAVDPTNPLRVYVSWQYGAGFEDDTNKALLATSENGGRTFSEPVVLSDYLDKDGGTVRHPRLTVGGDGVVHAVIPHVARDSTKPVMYRQSNDHGKTWSKPVALQDAKVGIDRKWELRADPKSSNLYLVSQGALEPGAATTNTDRDLFLRVSSNGGTTWSEPIVINDDGSAKDKWVQQHAPGISVAPNGRLDIAWYDFRNSPYPEKPTGAAGSHFGGFSDVYYTSTDDQGQSFEPNHRVTDRLINREIGVWSNSKHVHGHVAVASTDKTVYFAWQDSRAGGSAESEDVYFASVQRDPSSLAGARRTSSDVSDVPPWILLSSAFMLGLGATMLIALLSVRRFGRATIGRER